MFYYVRGFIDMLLYDKNTKEFIVCDFKTENDL